MLLVQWAGWQLLIKKYWFLSVFFCIGPILYFLLPENMQCPERDIWLGGAAATDFKKLFVGFVWFRVSLMLAWILLSASKKVWSLCVLLATKIKEVYKHEDHSATSGAWLQWGPSQKSFWYHKSNFTGFWSLNEDHQRDAELFLLFCHTRRCFLVSGSDLANTSKTSTQSMRILTARWPGLALV